MIRRTAILLYVFIFLTIFFPQSIYAANIGTDLDLTYQNWKDNLLSMDFESFSQNKLKDFPLTSIGQEEIDPLSMEALFSRLKDTIPTGKLESNLPQDLIQEIKDQDFEERIERLKTGVPPMPTMEGFNLDVSFIDKMKIKIGDISGALNQSFDANKFKEFLGKPLVNEEDFSSLAEKFGNWNTKNAKVFSSAEMFYR